jgi:cobalt-zinc-cadmium efflux system membrane fusion protein
MKGLSIALVLLPLVTLGCGGQSGQHNTAHEDDESWAVTAWGEHFEIFAEADPLVVGQVSKSHTHVTALHDFSALTEGVVVAVLRAADGSETTFRRDEALRAGIFSIEIEPKAEGTYILLFRVEGGGETEQIRAGRVRVGSADDPGGLVTSHSHDDGGEHGGHAAVGSGAEAISFLKEQQWRTAFSTEWTREGTVHSVARGPGLIRPVAGGEIVLTAPLGGVVVGDPAPYVGLDVGRGAVVFELTPRVAGGRTLGELVATHTEKESALNLAEDRLARLEALLPLEAVSSAEVEATRGQVTTLRAQHAAASRDLATAQAGRQGSPENVGRMFVSAPISGQIAEVLVTPGEVVEAGETLARLVQVDPLWVEVFLRPDMAAMFDGEPRGLSVRAANDAAPVSFGADRVRLVARSPEVSRRTGTVTCIFEVSGAIEELRLGSAVEAEVFLPETREGIVIPTSAVVDDGGIPVVYVQLDGEGFLRREVAIQAREGSSLLVDGLAPDQRLVTVGGAAIRRSTLVSSGVGEGHVH